ncbi:putative uncharacterized protein [Firmicutes bacterium CAG:308]|nr:putative uncharacterized protein [Firmicutes bacterium CAG:308]
MWTSLRIYIYKIVDFISGLSGLLYRTGWTSVNGILTLIPLPLILKNQLNQWLEVNPYARIVCNEDGSFVNPTCLSNQVKKNRFCL